MSLLILNKNFNKNYKNYQLLDERLYGRRIFKNNEYRKNSI